jgi:hypothetical protein
MPIPAASPIPHPNIDVAMAVKVPSSAPDPVRQMDSVSLLKFSNESENAGAVIVRKVSAMSSVFIDKPWVKRVTHGYLRSSTFLQFFLLNGLGQEFFYLKQREFVVEKYPHIVNNLYEMYGV